ncbi:MAG TPA: MBL fold metallo-hydrolase [bacterium]|nr:MBL fold metallo-hydrolase [bacterium]HPN45846.1 MBL fold metallo-hydrolase [bacterium]
MKKPGLFKVLLYCFLLLLFVSVANATEQDTLKLSDELYVIAIAPDAFQAIHYFPWPCNSLLCRLDSTHYVLVDTPNENQSTQLLVEWILKKHDGIHLQVINTHFHRDCLGGNGYLLAQHIPVYGSDLTAKLLTERMSDPTRDNIGDFYQQPQYKRYYDLLKATTLLPPDHLFKINDGLVITVGDDTLEVYYPGGGHTRDNIVVYWRNKQILFGGCILRAMSYTGAGYTGDADMEEWPKSLLRICARFPNARIVIPGHGDLGDLGIIQHTIDVLKNPQ